MKGGILAASVLATWTLAVPVQAQARWLHVEITGDHGGQSVVQMNLPLASLTAALPLIPLNAWGHCRLELNDRTVSRAEIAFMVQKLRNAPENAVLSIATDGDRLDASRSGDMLVVTIREENLNASPVQVRIPFAVAEAVSLGSGDRLDLRAATRALVMRGAGELVVVNSNDGRVRIWADGIPDVRR
ncbi:MAG: hypothetical protein ABI718_01075 [Acidobacteriota bacterium]